MELKWTDEHTITTITQHKGKVEWLTQHPLENMQRCQSWGIIIHLVVPATSLATLHGGFSYREKKMYTVYTEVINYSELMFQLAQLVARNQN